MDITMEDIEVCNCCGKTLPVDCLREVKVVMLEQDRKYYLCEDCDLQIANMTGGVNAKKVDNFIGDICSSFDVFAIAEAESPIYVFQCIAPTWRNFGLSG